MKTIAFSVTVFFVTMGGSVNRPSAETLLLHVVARNEDGSAAVGLRPEDFEVKVNSQPVQVESVTGGTAAPISAVLLLDVSYSFSPAPLDMDSRFREVVGAVPWAHDSEQRVAVGLISNRAVLGRLTDAGRPLLAEWNRLAGSVKPLERFGPSPLWDALDEASGVLAQTSTVRAVILLTDGKPTGNKTGAVEVATRSATRGVFLYVIASSDELPPSSGVQTRVVVHPCAVFEGVVRETGGSCFQAARRGLTAPNAVEQIMKELRSAYSVSVVLSGESRERREIGVRAKRDHVVMRARRTY